MRPVGLISCLEALMDFEKPCPKCGHTMHAIEEGSVANWGVKTVTVICPNCLHMETHSFLLVKTAPPELDFRSGDSQAFPK